MSRSGLLRNGHNGYSHRMETMLALALCLVIGVIAGHFWPQKPSTDPAEATAGPLDSLTEAISVLDQRLDTLERSESTREAMTTDALDKFTRLYKRMAERQAREDRENGDGEEHAALEVPAWKRGPR